jgi:hypothetical protein
MDTLRTSINDVHNDHLEHLTNSENSVKSNKSDQSDKILLKMGGSVLKRVNTKKNIFEQDVKMKATGYTKVFPREDNIFKKKDSLAFEESKALIWTDRPEHKLKERFLEILAYFLLAFAVGTIAFLMSHVEEKISHFTNTKLN